MDIEKQITTLDDYIRRYYDLASNDIASANFLLQKISGIMYYLASIRAELYSDYNDYIISRMSVLDENNKRISFNRAEVEAKSKYRAFLVLRIKLDSAKDVLDALRTNISSMKAEMHTSKAMT